MANGETPSRRLDFIIKRKPDGGFSDWLCTRARPGDAVEPVRPARRRRYSSRRSAHRPAADRRRVRTRGGAFDPDAGRGRGLSRRPSRPAVLRRSHHARRRRPAADQRYGGSGSAPISRRPSCCPKRPPPPPSARAGPALRFEEGMVHEAVARRLAGPPGEHDGVPRRAAAHGGRNDAGHDAEGAPAAVAHPLRQVQLS